MNNKQSIPGAAVGFMLVCCGFGGVLTGVNSLICLVLVVGGFAIILRALDY